MWPPREFDYGRALAKLGYREVPIADWITVPELDDDKLAKVYQLTQFRGVFRNSNQEMLDMRPKNSCPCFANLQKQPIEKLLAFAVRAYDDRFIFFLWNLVPRATHREVARIRGAGVRRSFLNLRTLHVTRSVLQLFGISNGFDAFPLTSSRFENQIAMLKKVGGYKHKQTIKELEEKKASYETKTTPLVKYYNNPKNVQFETSRLRKL